MNATPRLDLVFVELPKFTKEQHQLETLTEQWIYLMKYAIILTSVPEEMDSIPEIHKAFDIANQVNLAEMKWNIWNGGNCLFMTNRERVLRLLRQE